MRYVDLEKKMGDMEMTWNSLSVLHTVIPIIQLHPGFSLLAFRSPPALNLRSVATLVSFKMLFFQRQTTYIFWLTHCQEEKSVYFNGFAVGCLPICPRLPVLWMYFCDSSLLLVFWHQWRFCGLETSPSGAALCSDSCCVFLVYSMTNPTVLVHCTLTSFSGFLLEFESLNLCQTELILGVHLLSTVALQW